MKKSIYRVVFIQNAILFQLYAYRVCEAEIYGFIQIDDILLDEPTTGFANILETYFHAELKNVSSIYLPTRWVIRIDLLEKDEPYTQTHNNISVFPEKHRYSRNDQTQLPCA